MPVGENHFAKHHGGKDGGEGNTDRHPTRVRQKDQNKDELTNQENMEMYFLSIFLALNAFEETLSLCCVR